MDSRKFVFQETAAVLLGEVLCCAVMVGVFALLGKFGLPVVLGAAVGAVLSTLNFFFMAVGASLAADKAEAQDVKGGKAMISSSYVLRLVVLFAILFACAKSGYFDVFALVLPLIFVRPILSVGEFFRKKGDA